MPRRYEDSENPSSSRYKSRVGSETQMTSFRCNTILRRRLYDFAEEIGKDPSHVIREAVAEYLQKRIQAPQIPQKEHADVITKEEPKKPSAEDIWNNILKST